jgi:hypothetical protein
MNPTCIKIASTFLLLLITLVSKAQFNSFASETQFIKHLTKEHLYKEKLFLLQHLSDTSTAVQINLEKGWTYHALGRQDSAAYYYQQAPYDSLLHYGFREDYLTLLFNMESLDQLRRLTSSSDMSNIADEITLSLDLMSLRYTPEEVLHSKVPDYLIKPYSNYYKFSKKSGLLAGAYSALLPGAGKLYLGRKQEGFNMLLANVVTGLQAYESYRRQGMLSPRFIVFGGAFTVFYVANIYGAVAGTRKIKKEYRKQLHHEISHYYLRDYSQYPY